MKLKSLLKEGANFPELTLPMLNCRTGGVYPKYTPKNQNSVWIIQPGPGYIADPDWMQTCGAAGCTPGAKVFENTRDEFVGTGVQVYFVSSKSTEEQQMATAFKGLSFKFLSDVNLTLKEVLGLPTFNYKGKEYYYRQAFIVKNGVIDRIFTTNTEMKDQDSVTESKRHSEEVLKYAKQCFLSDSAAVNNPIEPIQKKSCSSSDDEPYSGFKKVL